MAVSPIHGSDPPTNRNGKTHAVRHPLVIKGGSPGEKSGKEVEVRSNGHENGKQSSVLRTVGLKRFIHGIAGQ